MFMILKKIFICLQFLFLANSLFAVDSKIFFINQEYALKAKSFESNSDIVENLYPGDKVKLLFLQENLQAIKKEDEYWAKVQFGSKEGYLPYKYIQKIKPTIKNNYKKKRASIVPKSYYVAVKSLPVRMEPSIDSIPIFSVSKHTEVIVSKFSDFDDLLDGTPGRWAFLSIGRAEGWVFGGYLSENKIADDTENIDRITSGKILFCNTNLLLKDEPSTNGSPLLVLEEGDSVEVIEKKRSKEVLLGAKSSWVHVKVGEQEGYIFGNYLSAQKQDKPKPIVMNHSFIYPLDFEKSKMTSGFGPRVDPVNGKIGANHTGIDLYPIDRFGAPIYSAGDGVVLHQSTNSGYGKLTVVRHLNGLVTYYAHQQRFLVKPEEKVKAGDLIGEVGSSGKSTGPHLHFEIRTGLWQEQLNPEKYIQVPSN